MSSDLKELSSDPNQTGWISVDKIPDENDAWIYFSVGQPADFQGAIWIDAEEDIRLAFATDKPALRIITRLSNLVGEVSAYEAVFNLLPSNFRNVFEEGRFGSGQTENSAQAHVPFSERDSHDLMATKWLPFYVKIAEAHEGIRVIWNDAKAQQVQKVGSTPELA